MSPANQSPFTFGPFELDPARLVLSLGGEPLALGPRVVETLLALLERAGEVVAKAELLERVWPNADVEEANLTQNVYVLRKVFRAHWTAHAIQTIQRRGYRFVAPVERAVAGRVARRPVGARRAVSYSRRVVAAALLCVATLALAFASHGPAHSGPPPLGARGAESYELGHYYWNLRTRDGFSKSMRYFAEVTRTDPLSPLGYAGLAADYALMPGYVADLVSARVARARAWSYVHKALALDPRSSEAYAVAGYLESDNPKHFGAGVDEFERAIALDPHNASAHLWLGSTLYERGLVARARAEFETAERLEPASPATESWLAMALFLNREYDAAADRLHRALDLDPTREDALKALGTVEAQRGALKPALDAFARLARTCPHCGGYLAVLRAYAYAKTHRPLEARAAVAAASRKVMKGMDAEVAFVYVALGDRKHALAWLRRTRQDNGKEAALLALDPRLDPVRGDARFKTWTESSNLRT